VREIGDKRAMIVYNKTTLGIFAIVATLGILTASTALTLQPAHALSKFFNCTTYVANKKHNLTLEDVNTCYNKEFHSSGGPGIEITPTTTPIKTTESVEHRGSLHHHHGTTITSIHSPSSSEESHRASSHNERFSSSSAEAVAASIDELLRGYSGGHSSSSASGEAAASSSSGGASASSTAIAR
jgi:hypothetical protein